MLLPDNTFDAIFWQDANPAALDQTLTGCRILGAEKAGTPDPEGLLLYLEDQNGKQLALYADAGVIGSPGKLLLQIGSVPE